MDKNKVYLQHILEAIGSINTDMRNILTHEYFGVNTKIVWDTYQIDLPKLKDVIYNIL